MDLKKIEDVMKELDIKKCTVYTLIKKGLPCIKLGSSYRFDMEKVREWINNRIEKK